MWQTLQSFPATTKLLNKKILFSYLVRSGGERRTTKHISVDNPLIIIPLLKASSIVVPGLYLIYTNKSWNFSTMTWFIKVF